MKNEVKELEVGQKATVREYRCETAENIYEAICDTCRRRWFPFPKGTMPYLF